MVENKKLNFLTYIKAISVVLILIIHVGTAYFNANNLWSWSTATPMLDDCSYPRLIRMLTVCPNFWGYLVFLAVQSFFLVSGFTIIASIRKKTFIQFWIEKLIRFGAPYCIVLVINVFIIYLNTLIYGTDFPFSLGIILQQLCLGLQYIIPGFISIDLVIWFLGVLLIYFIIASCAYYIVNDIRGIYLMDGIIILVLLVLGLGKFESSQSYFLIKALCFSLFINIATILYFYHIRELELAQYIKISGMQLLLFLIAYRCFLAEIEYLSETEFIPYFISEFLLFWFLYTCETSLKPGRMIKILSECGYSLYILHPVIGYSSVRCLIARNVSRSISIAIALFIMLVTGIVFHYLVEYPLTNAVSKKVKIILERRRN